MARDYYGILGVERGASDQEIKRAYRKLARELHPDVNPDESAQARFQEMSTAYEVLTDPEKRRIVDAGGDPLASAVPAAVAASATVVSAAASATSSRRSSAAPVAARVRGPRGRVQPGSDALLRMKLDLDECAAGVSKEVNVDTADLCATSVPVREPTATASRSPVRPARVPARSSRSSARSSVRS